jgi:putative mRNA 3-end processing factor
MVKIHCLGGCLEVGRNAFLIDAKSKVMLDYGAKVETGETPMLPKTKVDGLFITHGHLDHLGLAPYLHKITNCKVYSTAPTYDFSNLLLRDSLKVAKIKQRKTYFSPADILSMNKNYAKVRYGDDIKIGDITIETWDAGHVPGSAIFVAKTEGKKILYTGDFNLNPTRLVHGAHLDTKNIDAVIMENTYSSRDHPPRDEQEKELFKTIKETIEKGGVALLPTFAVRAPELLMILDHFGANFPIYLDGMAKDALTIMLDHPEFLKNPKALHDAADKAIKLYENDERNNAMKDPCAIITTGGAMEGGPIVHYMKTLYAREDSSILLTGFQIPKTAGRYLADTGRYIVGAIDFKVKMQMKQFDFSAHAGRSELIKFVQKVRPEKLIAIHGEYCEKFATEMKGRFGIQTYAPQVGDIIKV